MLLTVNGGTGETTVVAGTAFKASEVVMAELPACAVRSHITSSALSHGQTTLCCRMGCDNVIRAPHQLMYVCGRCKSSVYCSEDCTNAAQASHHRPTGPECFPWCDERIGLSHSPHIALLSRALASGLHHQPGFTAAPRPTACYMRSIYYDETALPHGTGCGLDAFADWEFQELLLRCPEYALPAAARDAALDAADRVRPLLPFGKNRLLHERLESLQESARALRKQSQDHRATRGGVACADQCIMCDVYERSAAVDERAPHPLRAHLERRRARALPTPEVARLLHVLWASCLVMRSLGGREEFGTGFYTRASYLRHDCDPNCYTVFSGARVVVRALRPIAKGEELTIAKSPEVALLPIELRTKVLLMEHGLDCFCGRCRLELFADEAIAPEAQRQRDTANSMLLMSCSVASGTMRASASPRGCMCRLDSLMEAVRDTERVASPGMVVYAMRTVCMRAPLCPWHCVQARDAPIVLRRMVADHALSGAYYWSCWAELWRSMANSLITPIGAAAPAEKDVAYTESLLASRFDRDALAMESDLGDYMLVHHSGNDLPESLLEARRVMRRSMVALIGLRGANEQKANLEAAWRTMAEAASPTKPAGGGVTRVPSSTAATTTTTPPVAPRVRTNNSTKKRRQG